MFFVDVKFFIFWYINEVIILINLTLGGKMAGDEIEINIFCAKTECRSKIETVSVKKENMMLTSSEKIFCDSIVKDECVGAFNDQLFYYDDNHISIDGANLVGQEIIQKIYNITCSQS